jgi:hypothetical protein
VIELSSKFWLTMIGVASSAVVVGAVGAAGGSESPRAFGRPATPGDVIPSTARRLGALTDGESRLVVRFVSASGTNRGLYVTKTEDGSMICIWDTNLFNGRKGGGCNPSADFFAGRAFAMSLAYDGGPDVAGVTDARIVGVVTDEVARLDVVNSSGTNRRVAITADRGFAYVVPPGELKRGVGPEAVIAYDRDGHVIDRQITGIGE